jgi:hypothetical protein
MTNKQAVKKPRAKTIGLKAIEKQYKDINKMESFTLDEEQNLQIKYYAVFPESKIQELLVEANNSLTYVSENELDFFNDNEEFIKYIYFLIIRKFTSLESEIPENDFPAHVNIMNQIIDVGLFNKIFDEILDQSEVFRIVERLQQFVEMTARISEMTQKELEKAERLIKNKEVVHPLVNPAMNTVDSIG